MKWITDVCTFRLDDITPDMNWDKFYRVKAIFDKYRVKPLIGVVPDNQDETLRKGEFREEFWDCIHSFEKEGWTIAQHGYQHIYETTNPGLLGLKNASEFAGLSADKQLMKLRAGREILQNKGLDVKIFMAPGHTYDENTLKALKMLGFTCVTDGYADIPYYDNGLLFIPCRVSRPGIRHGVDTVCLHCNEMKESDYRELENFLEKNSDRVLSYSDILNQLWYPRKCIGIRVSQKKNLMLHKCKKFAALSPACQEYFQKTDDADRKKKWEKRVCKLPDLAVKLCREKKKESTNKKKKR